MQFKILFTLLGFTLNAQAKTTQPENIERDLKSMCAALDGAYQKRKWGKDPCGSTEWIEAGKSVKGRPLIYADFGPKDSKNVTLVLSMVHGDEITPLYSGFQMVAWATTEMKKYPRTRLVIAPLVNPDGFLDYPKTRVNANGVDCNRNFKTADWEKDALKSWKKRFSSNPRRFPGHKPDSEPETLFQKMLIEKFKPQKIVSIHSPLNMIDYDGPDHLKLAEFNAEYIQKCEELRKAVKANSTGFFPGSLGNYSGVELGIPTITLELPTADYRYAVQYWERFKKGLETVVQHELP
jgi:murein peptide amidase A